MASLGIHCPSVGRCPHHSVGQCNMDWFQYGWECPYCWRPNDLPVEVGSRIEITLARARQWTGRLDIAERSELHCNRDLRGLHFKVEGVHLAKNYTQVQVECSETSLLVYMNVWHRYNRAGKPCGVRWARMVSYQTVRRCSSKGDLKTSSQVKAPQM